MFVIERQTNRPTETEREKNIFSNLVIVIHPVNIERNTNADR